MDPDQSNPHWDAIVGRNWPEIPPSHWHSLAAAARHGAHALDTENLTRTSHLLDNAVRDSAALAPLIHRIAKLSTTPRTWADTLRSAAETLDHVGEVVARTRHRILDIVDRTTHTINQQNDDADDTESDRTTTLLARARTEVEEVVDDALTAFGPAGLFDLPALDPPRSHPADLSPRGDTVDPDPPRHGTSAAPPHRPAPDPGPMQPHTVGSNSHDPQAEPPPPAGAAGSGAALGPTASAGPHRTPHTDTDEFDPEPTTPAVAAASENPEAAPLTEPPTSSPNPGGTERSSAPESGTTHTGSETVAAQVLPSMAAIFGTFGLLTAAAAASATGTAASGSPTPPAAGLTSTAHTRPPASSPTTTAAPSPATAAAVSGRLPIRTTTARDSEERAPESMRDTLAAAMVAATAPSHIAGDRLDGDLVLARTILASARAAAPPTPGLGWAVSIMRHPTAVSAFLTTSEGCGWIPAGVFLPSEVSTPWAWPDAQTGWALADPAVTLAEFATRWGTRNAATLSALASSHPVPAELRRQLGPRVSLSESVAAESVLDLTRPRPGLHDRLASIDAGSTDPFGAIPEHRLRARAIAVAWKANIATNPYSTPLTVLRKTILTALRRTEAVPPARWEHLREHYDALAAELARRRSVLARTRLSESLPEHDIDCAVVWQLLDERRRTELVLLLDGEHDRQLLREMRYARHHLTHHDGSRPAVISTHN
ncbi:hypothetical protein JK358_35705 [Nocardia sp. 2]|uniref:Uncharacterized protein n=1 Tax=Nocardia acididurans TaxID=2802282 RepID=A0ABS1MHL4_9NOCA|nr:hypothetical protein [Nocardia acididurans]MBL1079761.1 hypothetical protein [Nocardia acididurans]